MLPRLTLLAFVATIGLAAHDTLPDMKIGDPLPKAELAMPDVSGKELSLKDAAGAHGVVVIFSCNTCPFVIGSDGSEGWEGRYPALGEFCNKNNVGFVLVNSNEAKREAGDSFADMQAHYKAKGYNGKYLLDKGHVVADAFGARTTPHVFLFDKDLHLAYKGAIDDNVDSAKAVKAEYLRDAISAMVEGRAIATPVTRNLGCSIKRTPHAH
jgi:peroxiredoxin